MRFLLTIASILFGAAIVAIGQTYEYIVVGSGPTGGSLARRLTRAGHSVLLIEASDDQGTNYNYTVPGLQAAATQDPKIRWDMSVHHYRDQSRARRDLKLTYQRADGPLHVPICGGPPPTSARPLGILYPAGVLGGCVSHHALIWIPPQKSDWDYAAQTTGNSSWTAFNMDKYLDCVYEWLSTAPRIQRLSSTISRSLSTSLLVLLFKV